MKDKTDLPTCLIIAFIFLTIFLFLGDPDLMDGIIYWLSDGNLTPNH